ncbi:Tpk1 [Symbiodinium natans]|uniref:Tpk1 protein n=1 Tax=Symbiodinium natans TaxID=878477 RepID=A0A812I245_9DINO|nr:Tpk1 [Symbiodinium natans]
MAAQAPDVLDWTWMARAWQSAGAQEGAEAALEKFGLILLNTPMSRELLETTWSMTGRHIVADGGAKVLQNMAPEFIPDLIVGDFDSAPKAVLEAYREKGVEVRDLSDDQDSTDLEKCLQAAKEAGCERVCVVGQFAGVDGRLDHTFAAMNAMQKAAHLQDICVALVSDDCICALLRQGCHRVGGFAAAPSSCGLVPLGGPVKVSTQGLHWDVEEAKLEWGGLISTSNCLDSKGDGFVRIETSGPVLWMCSRTRAKVE